MPHHQDCQYPFPQNQMYLNPIMNQPQPNSMYSSLYEQQNMFKSNRNEKQLETIMKTPPENKKEQK